ncbi:MAG: alpha/beta hydrolase [Propionibacteriaceae bacterium]|nr:alpha/beta hydrolase [Propionibacteriaceae bacterium]
MKRTALTLAISLVLGTAAVATATPAAAETQIIGGIAVSTTAGTDVDRPTYAEPTVTIKGFKAAPGADLASYLAQKVTWKACGAKSPKTTCAKVLVPLDYANPGGQAITIAMRKRPATKKPRLGTLFINPGGPGGSGKDLVPAFQRDGLEQYDIVGWDPRGVGDSTPVVCEAGDKMDALYALDLSPDSEAERAKLLKASRQFAKSCWDKNGSYLNYVGTQDTVRDLDFLRQLLGNAKLNYFGYSYGTQIGAYYAQMFGKNTGRMVLDAAVNITGNEDVIQQMGFDTALKNFASWCAKSKCGLGKTQTAVISKLKKFLKQLDAKPMKISGMSRKLTESMAALGIGYMLYLGEFGWVYLGLYVEAALQGYGEYLLWAGDQLNDRRDDGTYGSTAYALPAVNCVDYSDQGVLASDKDWKKAKKLAPFFGKYFGPDYICPMWPVKSQPIGKITGKDAAPLLVIGTTGDNATPYQQAKDMAKALKSATLLTYHGEGHGAYGGNSTCVDKAVVKFLAKGKLSKTNFSCKK